MSRRTDYWDATVTMLLILAAVTGFLYWISLLSRQQVTPPETVSEVMELKPREVPACPPSR